MPKKSPPPKKSQPSWAAKTLVEVSQFFGVDRTTVTDWRNKGMPGIAGKFPLDEIAQWLRREIYPARNATKPDKDTSREELEEEKLRIGNAREMLKLQREAGELVDRAVAMAMWETGFNIVRSRLELLPEDLSTGVPAEHRIDLVEDAKKKIALALRELAAVAEETDL